MTAIHYNGFISKEPSYLSMSICTVKTTCIAGITHIERAGLYKILMDSPSRSTKHTNGYMHNKGRMRAIEDRTTNTTERERETEREVNIIICQ
jgi:hypothetical protein